MERTAAEKFTGYAFHTAFRKALMDTPADAIIWNVIYLLGEVTWGEFIRNVRDGDGTLKDKCLAASENMYGDNAAVIFREGLRLLTDEQWAVLEKYVVA